MITIYGSKTHKQFKLVSFTPLLLKAYFLSSENYLGTSEKRFFHFHRHLFIRRPRLFCSTNCKLFFNKWAGNQLKIFIFSPKIEVVRFSSLVRFRRLSPIQWKPLREKNIVPTFGKFHWNLPSSFGERLSTDRQTHRHTHRHTHRRTDRQLRYFWTPTITIHSVNENDWM